MASYTDDNTPYTFSPELDATLTRLKTCAVKIFEWFHKNRFKSTLINAIISQPLSLKKKFKLEKTSLASINRVKLLGTHVDGQLNFNYHIS